MARISTYPFDTNIVDNDAWIGSESQNRSTKQFTALGIANYIISSKSVITGSGTLDTVPIFTGTNEIGDSIITYNSAGNSISITGDLKVIGTANFNSNVTMDVGLTIDDFLIADGNIRLLGPTPFLRDPNKLTVNGDTELKGEVWLAGRILDSTGSYSTAAGKVLKSNANSELVWEDVSTPDYLSFVCLLSQSNEANPQPDLVLENSLDIQNPFTSFTRVSSGVYNLNAPGKFKSLKTIVFVNNGSALDTSNVTWTYVDTDNIQILTSANNSKLTKASLEIRTYN